MTDFEFEAKIRINTAKKCRQSGFIPAVVYGKKIKNINIELPAIDFSRVFKSAGTSNLINLILDNNDKLKVLVQDIQLHPVTNGIEHVDLFKVDMKEKIKTDIPLEFIGDNSLVIDQEGTLITNKDSVEVECLPSDLVDHLDIDISVISNWDINIKVSDIKAPSGIEILDDMEEVVALIQPPRSEEELEALDEEVVEDVEAVEVENAGEEEEKQENSEDKDK